MTTPDANIAFVTPALITWAIKRSGLSYAQLKDKLRVNPDQILAWEHGKAYPPFDKAQELAKVLQVPFGYLFLSKIPADTGLPIKDFRTLGDSYKPSASFLALLSDVQMKQHWYRDYLKDEGEAPLKFVGKFSIRDTPRAVAADIRAVLHLSPALRKSAYSWQDYLRSLTRNADEARLLVMRSGVVGNNPHKRLSFREFQGFAISDAMAPVVFVNSDDFVAAQIFTLMHEIAHIWLGQSAISNPDPSVIEAPIAKAPDVSKSRIEEFCNQVAVEVLVPRLEFTDEWKGKNCETIVENLARYFWVSNIVVLRRAYELQKITKTQFLELLPQLRQKARPKQKVDVPGYYRKIAPRMSRRVTTAVLTDLNQGRILYRDAAGLLSLGVPTLTKFAAMHRS
jgi:Zn-dependent peptidase ImmA (M78 family)/transcriptional regulator with XRE-family HTH domain